MDERHKRTVWPSLVDIRNHSLVTVLGSNMGLSRQEESDILISRTQRGW